MAFSFKITTNKVLFIVVVLIDVFFHYQIYTRCPFFWMIILPVAVPLLLFLKYYHFMVCYVVINRRNVNMTLVSIGLSIVYMAVCYAFLFLFTNPIILFVVFVVGFVNFVINIYFAANVYFMKSLLYFDVNIPVDGYGVDEKVDQFAANIPGL